MLQRIKFVGLSAKQMAGLTAVLASNAVESPMILGASLMPEKLGEVQKNMLPFRWAYMTNSKLDGDRQTHTVEIFVLVDVKLVIKHFKINVADVREDLKNSRFVRGCAPRTVLNAIYNAIEILPEDEMLNGQ